VLDMQVNSQKQRTKKVLNPRTKWWQLKGEKQVIFRSKLMEENVWETQESANLMWEGMANGIRKVAKAVLGESKGFGPKGKESWWWNENVQEKIKYKRECFKALHLENNEDNWKKYRTAKKATKKAVSEARSNAFEGFYQALGTKKGEQQIYKLAKGRERKIRDLDQVKCVKDEEGKVLVTESDIKERWRNYFHKLFNKEQTTSIDVEVLTIQEEDLNFDFYRRI